MIKITDLSESKKYYFPKNIHPEIELYVTANSTLKLHSNSSLKDKTIYLNDIDTLDDYYVFQYDWSLIDEGEYEYSINDVEFGLLRIGETPKTKRTDKTKKYNNQDKNVIYYGE